ncbi:uncharacterized protein KY384_001606 [Bacidia gigantensis]|uniref:uncharacterized protein n=1 Tax=Bacidia gigantensis TaxID=2732470 RepID=UPI001D048036|nr:uncharacterized protein KY384_001606 [Bacidia gigantensis]KAG8533865.1 hypothetical protein KY384_001606 [Bacidia gigantensis]
MAADSLDVWVLAFTDPAATDHQPQRDRLGGPAAFRLSTENIRTLSTNTINQASDVEGLLYVPDLDLADSCRNASAAYVPNNVTRFNDLPPIQYQYISFAPWISAACTKSYLNAASGSQPSAFLFYNPLQTTTDTPPPISDQFWNLNDGGQWKKRSEFPVYAISGPNGAGIMNALSQYSGPISSIPGVGPQLQQFNPNDYVRLFANFNLDASSNLPTLWAFLLIVLAIVLILVGITSLSMHIVQRRHRRSLQRRVENGEVTLEMLGIKKPRLTQADINALPLTTYTVDTEKKPPQPLPADPSSTAPANTTTAPPSDPPKSPTPAAPSPQDFSQPTCPICLDDYIPSTSQVRSLPCHHIFHPDCIDNFLLTTPHPQCPMCKMRIKASAPITFSSAPGAIPCPPITNAMVRRERYARRLRDRGEHPSSTDPGGVLRWASFRRQFRPPLAGGGGGRSHGVPVAATGITVRDRNRERGSAARIGGSNTEVGSGNSGTAVEMQNVPPVPTVAERPRDLDGRREWARRRASALLGRNQPGVVAANGVSEDVEEAGEGRERRGVMRRGLGRVFPGFR